MLEQPVPESTLPYAPLHVDKKFIVLSDWFDLKSGLIYTNSSNTTGMAQSRPLIRMIVGPH